MLVAAPPKKMRRSAEGSDLGAPCYVSQSSPSPAVLHGDYNNPDSTPQPSIIGGSSFSSPFPSNLGVSRHIPPQPPAMFPPISRGAGQRPVVATQYELFKANTGWKQSSEQYRENTKRRTILADQTKHIAEALESQGIEVVQNNGGLVALGEITGAVDAIDSYRAISFLPTVAQRDRKPILNALLYFQKNHRMGKHLRMAVVTAGDRVSFGSDVRGTMQKLSRDISRWASEADKLYGVAVIYRGTEFTIDEDCSFHIHANVLYAPRKRLPEAKWSQFLSWSHQRLGAHWQDSGKLEKPQEAIKYPFKPLELNRLDAPALAWLYHETKGLKIAQPMRDFRHWRERLEFTTEKQERVDPFTGEVVVKEIKVKRERPLKVGMVNTPDGARMMLIEKAARKAASSDTPSTNPEGTENMIICRSAPQFRFSPYAEPITMVMNYTPNPVTEEGRRRLEEIKARSREARRLWDNNGAPCPEVALNLGRAQRAAAEGAARNVRPFNVHTSRSTVQRQTSIFPKRGSGLSTFPGSSGPARSSTPGISQNNSTQAHIPAREMPVCA